MFILWKTNLNPLKQFIMQHNHNKVAMFCLCMRSHEGSKLLTLSIMTEYSFACVQIVFFPHIYYVMQIKWELVGLKIIYLLHTCADGYIQFAFYIIFHCNFLAMFSFQFADFQCLLHLINLIYLGMHTSIMYHSIY